MFNLLNHANFGNPDLNISNGTVGTITTADDGRTMRVNTPFTPRPFDHTLANGLGHVVVVTNRGLHTSSSVNSQQNRITPDWPDIVTRERPGASVRVEEPDVGIDHDHRHREVIE